MGPYGNGWGTPPTPRTDTKISNSPIKWVVEWREGGQYRINETPHKDVAKRLYLDLGDRSNVTERRLTRIETVAFVTSNF